ncbi:MAG: MoaD/ThiS family protein, partial [Bacteroidia bacterium]|nr:MoaD/ThiS family protein [Bacteroidia bacterium]
NSKYLIAVQKEIISSDTVLNNNDTVALLPPYAGG